MNMIRKIKEEFRQTLIMQLWLDDSTKRIIINKLMSSVVEIPYYEILLELLDSNRIYDDASNFHYFMF